MENFHRLNVYISNIYIHMGVYICIYIYMVYKYIFIYISSKYIFRYVDVVICIYTLTYTHPHTGTHSDTLSNFLPHVGEKCTC